MPKPARGLPKDFQLNVPAAPVELGDYLDEQPPPPKPSLARVPEPVAPAPVEVLAPEPAPAAIVPPTPQPEPDAIARQPRPGGPPRKQFNMTPETLRMVDDLLVHLRHNSAERDVRASELLHALVLTVHEVRPLLDLSRVPLRGRWGSTSAAALPIAIKEAFQEAIAKSRARGTAS